MKEIRKESIMKFLNNKNNLLIIVLLGVLFMVIAIPVDTAGTGGKSASGRNDNSSYQTKNTGTGYQAGGTAAYTAAGDGTAGYDETAGTGYVWEQEQYIKEMEAKAESLLSGVNGAGQVKVMITLRASSEQVVEKDMPVTRSQTSEQDSQGGSRMVSEFATEDATVYRKGNGYEEPYVVKTLSPRVEGVVVVAQGAGNGEVSKNLSEAVQILFGVEAHRVKVLKAG
ncbi:MAG: stage III sporulation protein AG [Lachnospiraceae bacterium]|nr:stage III sporulation protein AG [Lachnospiraceae bacterium]